MSTEPFVPSRRGTLETADGLQLHTQWYLPSTPPRAVVVFIHGYAEHCGRYESLCRAFTEEGAAVYVYDQRGHGRSGGRRAYVSSFDRYIDDLDLYLEFVRSQIPNRPLFLFGHSMGGLIALKYVLERAHTLRGLLLSAPALEINPDLAPHLRQLAQLLGTLAPSLPTVRSPEDAISRDPAVVAEAKNDPLNYHGRVKARTGAEMLRAGKTVRRRLEDVQIPFLVIHGTADTLTSPECSQELYDRAPVDDKTLTLYDGLHHEPFHEPEKDRVLADLSEWLRNRLD